MWGTHFHCVLQHRWGNGGGGLIWVDMLRDWLGPHLQIFLVIVGIQLFSNFSDIAYVFCSDRVLPIRLNFFFCKLQILESIRITHLQWSVNLVALDALTVLKFWFLLVHWCLSHILSGWKRFWRTDWPTRITRPVNQRGQGTANRVYNRTAANKVILTIFHYVWIFLNGIQPDNYTTQGSWGHLNSKLSICKVSHCIGWIMIWKFPNCIFIVMSHLFI